MSIRILRGPDDALNQTVLDDGQLGYGTTSNLLKVGNGVNPWIELPSIGEGTVSWDDVISKPTQFNPSYHTHDSSDIVTGCLSVERGGTGASSASQALANLGGQPALGFTPIQQGGGENQIPQHKVYLGWTGYSLDVQVDDYNLGSIMTSSEGIHEVLPVSKGGTGATDADTARINLGAQASLGFTPIQQGGGTNQGTNKVYIGWTGNSLDVQVDNVNLGSILTSGQAISEVLPVSRGGTGALNAADARTNLGFYKVRLYQGNLSAGSATLEYGSNYRALIIVGHPSTSNDLVSITLSGEAWTSSLVQLCDNQDWLGFNITDANPHLSLNILSNQYGGAIVYVFGLI